MNFGVVVLFGLLGIAVAQPTLSGYDKYVNLTDAFVNYNTGENATVYYGLYYTVTGSTIRIGVVCDTSGTDPYGWCGFGISQTGLMVGNGGEQSDAFIGYINPANPTTVVSGDFVARGRYPPINCQGSSSSVCADTFIAGNCSNQITSVTGSLSGSYLTLEFTRPRAASDLCDVGIPVGVPTYILTAIGSVDINFQFPDNIITHEFHGMKNIAVTFTPPSTTGGLTTAASFTTGVAAATTGASITSAAMTSGAVPITSAAITSADVTSAAITSGAITSGDASGVATVSQTSTQSTSTGGSESSDASIVALGAFSLLGLLV